MAISSPVVQKNEYQGFQQAFAQGMELGAMFQKQAIAQEQQRQFDVSMMETNIKDMASSKLGLIQYAKEREPWFRNYFAKKFRLDPNSAEVTQMYNDLATGTKSYEEITAFQQSNAALLAVRGGEPQQETVEPPPVEAPENRTTTISGPTEKPIMSRKAGAMPYPQMKAEMMKAIEAKTTPSSSSPTDPRNEFSVLYNALTSGPADYKPWSEGYVSDKPGSGSQAQVLYDQYIRSGVSADEFINKVISRPSLASLTPEQLASMSKETRMAKTVVSRINNTDVKLADIGSDGIIKPTPEAAKFSGSGDQILSDIKKNFDPNMSDEDFKNAIWTMNKDKLLEVYGNETNAKMALDHGEWLSAGSKVQLRVKPPQDLSLHEQAEIGTKESKTMTATRSAAIKTAEDRVASIPHAGESWRFMTPEEVEKNWPYFEREYGYLAKTIGKPGSPGWADRYRAFSDNSRRVIDNITQGQGLEYLFKASDPMQLEIIKLLSHNAQWQAEMDYKIKALNMNTGVDQARLELDRQRISLGWAELEASKNGKNPIDKEITAAYDDLVTSAGKWLKANPNARGTNMVEIIKQFPEAQGHLSRLNVALSAKYGGNVSQYKLRTKYEFLGAPKEYEYITYLHPAVLDFFKGDVIGETGQSSPQTQAPQKQKRTSTYSSMESEYYGNTDRSE